MSGGLSQQQNHVASVADYTTCRFINGECYASAAMTKTVTIMPQ